MGIAVAAVCLLLIGAVGYIRLAPSDPGRWHLEPAGEASRVFDGGVVRVVTTDAGGLRRLDRIARATARTHVLAGSVEEGMITYVTRTKIIGFPDYTTAQQTGDTLRIHARLRFGRSDLGVNGRRVDQWLTAMQTGG